MIWLWVEWAVPISRHAALSHKIAIWELRCTRHWLNFMLIWVLCYVECILSTFIAVLWDLRGRANITLEFLYKRCVAVYLCGLSINTRISQIIQPTVFLPTSYRWNGEAVSYNCLASFFFKSQLKCMRSIVIAVPWTIFRILGMYEWKLIFLSLFRLALFNSSKQ